MGSHKVFRNGSAFPKKYFAGKDFLSIFAVPKEDRGRRTGEVAEWSNAAVLKTVDPRGSLGSNPCLSAGD